MVLPATSFIVAASIVIGGGTRSGFLGDAVLQLLSVPVLLLILYTHLARSVSPAGSVADRHSRWAFVACIAVLLGPALQLVPLPPAVWTLLPDREIIAHSFELLGHPLPWLPVSMVPRLTWTAGLSLLPPAAIFLGTVLIGYRERQLLSLALLSMGLSSVLLGLMQIAQGPDSSLRFFEFTNSTDAVGFFANRNHFAALLYCLTVFAAAWAIDIVIITKTANRWFTSSMLIVIAALTVLVVLIGAQSMARSRAGIGLSLAALASAFALAAVDRRTHSAKLATRLLAAAVTLALLFTMQLALFRILDRFDRTSLVEGRIAFTQRTYAIATEHLLIGTGLGTFVGVYPIYEPTEELLGDTYVNHAHNDFAQLLMEAGVWGGAVMLLFALWLAVRAYSVWRHATSNGGDLDRALARAAVVVVVLLLIHSAVDYPLRTGAMLAIFAFALGLLVPPPAQSNRHDSDNTPIFAKRPAPRWSRQPAAQAAAAKPCPTDLVWPTTGAETMPAARSATQSDQTPPTTKTGMNWPGAWNRQPEQVQTGPPVVPQSATRPVWPTAPEDEKP